jgi:hypothetical protein
MRRLAFAAVCGTLILAACSDQSPTEPTPPPQPEQSLTCRPAHHFPIVQVSALIVKVFPKGKLQIEALARGAATALLWETCKKPLAQRSAIEFVNFMNANSSKLIGTQTQRNTLISLVLNGVEIPFTTPPGGTGDFGVGFFDPGKTTNTVVKTLNGTALVELEPGSFNQPTSIVVSRKSDGFTLTNFDGDQFPPYFDYDAINAAGDHVLKNGKTAIVAFCLLDPVYTYPENPRIGHNPVVGAPGFPFEVLEEVNLADHPGLAAQLHCGNLDPNTIIIGGFGRGLPGLANAAWKTARYYLAPAAQNLFLPEALHAATLAVGTLPPPAGRAPSLSPFGIVDATPDFTVQNSGETDPVGGTFTAGQPIDLCSGDGCGPRFRIDNGDGYESGTITATLIPVDGSTGTLSGTTSVPTDEDGIAEFNNLIVSAPGTYQLKFAAANSVPYPTGTFRVASAGVTELACNQEGTVKSLESSKAVQLEFTNNTSVPVAVYWLNFDGVREYPFVIEGSGIGVPYAVLAPGASYTQETFVTHPWLLESDDETATCYGIFLPGTENGEVIVP